jgi:hypothetical protein
MDWEKVLKELKEMGEVPKPGTKEYGKWLGQADFFQFLLDSTVEDVPIYVSGKGIYIYSLLVEQKLLRGDYVTDLMDWQCAPGSTWGYGYSFTSKGHPKNIRILEPFNGPANVLRKAMPLTFLRDYEGRIDQRMYVEISQVLAHLHGLHLDEPRNAYCRLNKEGDVDEIIKIHYLPEEIVVTIRRDVLDFHLFISKTVLVRCFDVTRCYDWTAIHAGDRKETTLSDQTNEIYARHGIIHKDKKPQAAWSRGFQIIRNKQPRKKMLRILEGKELEPKKYEKFIAHDWKNKRIAECSCDPRELASYFVKSDKPFQITPAFFKPDVLLKYKSDPEKYKLSQRSITCRNSWHLKTYDINEKGQVTTYLCYLGALPHSEQLHWKQYNEKPKAPISERAYKTDFLGEWDLAYDPLSALRGSLKKLEEAKKEIWHCPDENLFTQLNYVVSNSLKEWSDEIDTLDKLVIEGLRPPYLKKLAKSMNCYDEKLAPIKLLKQILVKKGIDQGEIDIIISPLTDIHHLRTKFSGHIGGQEAKQIRKELISNHGSLKNHFRNILERVDQAIKEILELTTKGYLD